MDTNTITNIINNAQTAQDSLSLPSDWLLNFIYVLTPFVAYYVNKLLKSQFVEKIKPWLPIIAPFLGLLAGVVSELTTKASGNFLWYAILGCLSVWLNETRKSINKITGKNDNN